jgi:hypothetical protein
VLLIFLFLCVMCIYVLIPRCDVRYDFHIKRCSVCLYLQLFVEGPISYLRYLCLCAYSGVFVLFVCLSSSYVASFSGLSMFICLRLMLPVSLDCPCLFVFVLCTICCQFLWIVHVYLPFRYSPTFISDLLVQNLLINGWSICASI